MTKQKNILGEVKRKKNNKVLLNIGLCEKPDNEMNFIQAFVILLLAIFAFIFINHVVDTWSLQTCEMYGDCAEVIRDINE